MKYNLHILLAEINLNGFADLPGAVVEAGALLVPPGGRRSGAGVQGAHAVLQGRPRAPCRGVQADALTGLKT